MDYVRVLYKRRWIAIPAFLIVVRRRRDEQLPDDADLRGAHAAADREGHAEGGHARARCSRSRTAGTTTTSTRRSTAFCRAARLARRAVELMNLPAHPSLIRGLPAETTPHQRDRAVLSGRGTTGSRQGAQQGTRAAAGPTPEPDDPLAPYVDLVLGSLSVAPVRNSRLVELRFTSPIRSSPPTWPTRSRRRTSSRALEIRFTASKDATDWLSGGSPSSARRSRRARRRCSSTRKKHDAVAVEDRQNIVVQRLADLNARGDEGEDRAHRRRKRSTTS